MYKILSKNLLAENINEYVIEAPKVAKHAHAGQFIILRVDEDGERIPLTICDYDVQKGTVTVLVQTVGATTYALSLLGAGDHIADFVGPLGNATELGAYHRVALVGGGVGSAVILPQAKVLHALGNEVDVIIGARNKSLLLYEDKFRKETDNVYCVTDDGSYGEQGFVTTKLKERIDSGVRYDVVLAVGPMPMMRAVANLTKEYGIKTVVSMNTIMVDGTGMCGGCRLTVGGETKYACVDGPEFDGHLVDFDSAIARSKTYKEFEQEHYCKMREKYTK